MPSHVAAGEGPAPGHPQRPAVSVILPFHGDAASGECALGALASLDLDPSDEILVADNTPAGVLADVAHPPGVTVVPAPREQSAYHARNVASSRAVNDWLLFLDADCRPRPDILAAYFAQSIPAEWGAVAGEVHGARDQRSLAARYARSRRALNQADGLRFPYRPSAVTANLLVRRAAWRAVGGFHEGVRSGEDSSFCWRLQDAGWQLGYREDAWVEHRHRDTVRALLRQKARDAAGRAWLVRRYPGSYAPLRAVRKMLRSVAAGARWTLAGQRERAAFRFLDTGVMLATWIGIVLSNVPPSARPARRPSRASAANAVVVLVDQFAEVSETFVVAELRALAAQGIPARVEATTRARRPDPLAVRETSGCFREDDSALERAGALTWLALRHPVGVLRDLVARRRWRREEPVAPLRELAPVARRLSLGGERHLHAHFAAGAALDSLRLSRLMGVTYSVTAHGYDIFMTPRNLREKLARAAFATSGSDYTVARLREVAGRAHTADVHRIVMGVDGERFRRSRPLPGGRTVLAVGRLVEKKGFRHLVEAAALLEATDPLERVVIVGDGPLRKELAALARERGVADRVELLGARGHDEVRVLLEQADVVAVPCVIARDGDRDSMPVIAKEALAMEVPVVGSDVAGVPEVVRPEWGRLVPPEDAVALAEAIEDLLALDLEGRAAIGRAGREFVVQHCDVRRETGKLVDLFACVGGRRGD